MYQNYRKNKFSSVPCRKVYCTLWVSLSRRVHYQRFYCNYCSAFNSARPFGFFISIQIHIDCQHDNITRVMLNSVLHYNNCSHSIECRMNANAVTFYFRFKLFCCIYGVLLVLHALFSYGVYKLFIGRTINRNTIIFAQINNLLLVFFWIRCKKYSSLKLWWHCPFHHISISNNNSGKKNSDIDESQHCEDCYMARPIHVNLSVRYYNTMIVFVSHNNNGALKDV